MAATVDVATAVANDDAVSAVVPPSLTEYEGAVETLIPLTPSTKPVLGVPSSVTHKVTWKNALFPPVVPLRVQPTPA